MARTFKNIQIEGKEAFVLFDTGSLRSYIREELASDIRQKVSGHVGARLLVYLLLATMTISAAGFAWAGQESGQTSLEERMAKVEGTLEQMANRLNHIETRLNNLEIRLDNMEARINSRFDTINSRFDSLFKWIIGMLAVMWVTIMGAIVGVMIQVASKGRRLKES